MIVSSKKFMTQLVESIGRMTAMCFENGVKADKEVTRDLGMMRDALWQIRDALWLIKDILADAAKEPEKPKPAEQEQSDWVTGPEAAKLLGWVTCNARMLKGAGIAFRQDQKCAKLSVSRPHIENYVARRNIKKKQG